MFRDENEKVMRKACGTKQIDSNDPISTTSGRRESPDENTAEPSLSSELPSLQFASPDASWLGLSSQTIIRSPEALSAIEDAGIEFFFKHYVTPISDISSQQPDITSSPLYPLLFTSRGFSNAVSCVGYAGLSNVIKNTSFMVIARKRYLRSIGDITADLKDAENADLKSTFKAVLVLIAFEVCDSRVQNRSTEELC